MANEIRQFQNCLGGIFLDDPGDAASLDTTAGGSFTLHSSAFAAMNAIGSTQHMMIVLDPSGVKGAPEYFQVTAHTTGVTSCTATGSQYGTSGRKHYAGELWFHGFMQDDVYCQVLNETVLTGTAASVTLGDIPATFRDLELTFLCQSDQASNEQINLTFNGDAAAHYDYDWVYGQAGTSGANPGSGVSGIFVGGMPGTGSASFGSPGRFLIPSYARTTFYKAITGVGGYNGNTTFTLNGWWHSTAAITSITLTPAAGNFVAGSVFTLRGFTGVTNP